MKTSVRTLACGIAAAILIGAGTFTAGADQTAVAPPEGSTPVLEVVADGVQIYTCDPKDGGFYWSFKPEASLFDKQGRQVGTYFGVRRGRSTTAPRSSQRPMQQNQAPFSGCCCAPTAMRARALFPASRISVGRKSRAGWPRAPAAMQATGRQQARMRYTAMYQFSMRQNECSGFGRTADWPVPRGGRTS